MQLKRQFHNNEIPKSDIKTNETLPVGQLLEDYNDTVDNILSVSDETTKELADNRVAVEILKNTPNVILDNVKGAKRSESDNQLYQVISCS